MEVARRFPGHWEFGAAWWQSPDDVCLPLGFGSIRVAWSHLWHPDAHSWRVEYHAWHPYNMRRFDALDELPRVAAEVIVAYANRGCSPFTGKQRPDRAEHRAALIVNNPTWLQVEIDRILQPNTSKGDS